MVLPRDLVSALAGTYTLLNTTTRAPNGTLIANVAYGDAPIGLLTYTRQGYMSATIAATEPELRPENLTFPFQASQSDEDWALVGKHTLAYAGPFVFLEGSTNSSGTVIHGPLTVGNVPSWVGSNQTRNYTVLVEQDGAVLLNIFSMRTDGTIGELWWQKLADLVGLV